MTRLAVALCLALAAWHAQASDFEWRLAAAQARLEERDYAALEALLAPLLAAPAPPLEALFLAGMAAMQQGDYPAAADRFRAMLARAPTLPRPRLELARALQESGQYDAARYHYEQVLAGPLPNDVRRNIHLQLADIRARRPSLRLAWEITSDTNPRQSTSSKVIMIGGQPYILSDPNQGKLEWGVAASVGLQYPLPGAPAWLVQADVQGQEYEGSALDNYYAQASLGRRFARGSDEIVLAAGGQIASRNDHGHYDGWQVGAAGRWVDTPHLAWLGEAGARTYRYPDRPFLDGSLVSLNVSAVYIPEPARRWQLGLGLARYSAQEDSYSYWQQGLNARGTREWPNGWVTGLRIQVEGTAFDAPDPFFGKTRRDVEGRVELEFLNSTLRWLGFSPQLVVGYVSRDSNLELYRYHRLYSRIGLSNTF